MRIRSERTKYAELQCRVVDALPPDRAPDLLIVLSHGFGAPAEDLVDFAPWLLDADDRLRDHCRFVFPAAPLDMAELGIPGGRAWWPINMEQLQRINEATDWEEFTAIRPDGLLPASTQLRDAVREMQRASGVDDSATVIGGFSQGAMVSTDVVLRHQLAPALLVLFSGTLLDREQWTAFAAKHPGCPVIQSHGTVDPVLPFVPAVQLRDMLQQSGFDVDFHSFVGQHTIPPGVVSTLGDKLTELVRRRTIA